MILARTFRGLRAAPAPPAPGRWAAFAASPAFSEHYCTGHARLEEASLWYVRRVGLRREYVCVSAYRELPESAHAVWEIHDEAS
ncbi:MAG: hypothetical protein FJZ38_08035 [Candidatus Rokubacteria bacterium]|nr:hypothetical protein [Candidatus Rokubacteria bacterium]